MLSTQHVSLLPSKSELSKDFIVICLHVNLPDEMNFENADECVDYIIKIKIEKVLFVILSNESWIIELVYQLSQIYAIYILNDNETKYEHQLINDHQRKVRGIYNHINILISQIPKDLNLFSRNLISFSISDNNDYDEEESLSNLLPLTFIKHRLFHNLCKKRRVMDAKEEMIKICREKYSNDKAELIKINDFEANYKPDQAIYWYTRDCFVYRLVNQAIRKQNIDDVCAFDFFIVDLYQQLCKYHYLYIKSLTPSSDFVKTDYSPKTDTLFSNAICAGFLRHFHDRIHSYIHILGCPNDKPDPLALYLSETMQNMTTNNSPS